MDVTVTPTASLSALLELSRALVSHQSVDDLVRVLTDKLRDVADYSYVAVMVYDEERDAMRMYALRSLSPAPHQADEFYAMQDSPSADVWLNQRIMIVNDVAAERRYRPVMQWLRDNNVASFCGFPLTTARRRMGALTLGTTRTNSFQEEDIEIARVVASQVAVALENALNYEDAKAYEAQLMHEKDRLAMLLEITNAVVSNLSLTSLISVISKSVRSAMRCHAVCVSLPDPDGKTMRVHGLDFPECSGYMQDGLAFPVEGSTPGRAFQTGKPMRYGRTPGFLGSAALELNRRESFQSGCFIPVVRNGVSLATLHLHDRRANFFDNQADVDFLVRIANQVAIALDNALKYSEVSESRAQLEDQASYLSSEIQSDHNFEEILGTSAALSELLRQVKTVAPTDSSVLIQGETGTGKELIARAIHNNSRRSGELFVKLNCAAIPLGLLESELFGHEKGAFTGAITQKKGRFEIADRGTLFLDEVGDIPLELQPKLLRVLQEQEFERLGSNKSLRVNVRLVTATNRDLEQMVQEGKFRADLYYRLNVFPLYLPPLRERSADIPELVRHFARKFGQRMNKTIREIPDEVIASLLRYDWPGNVRELQNVIERAVILSQDGVLRTEVSQLRVPRTENLAKSTTLESAEREHIVQALQQSDWVLSGPRGAAIKLGVPRTTLIYKMRRLNIPRRPADSGT